MEVKSEKALAGLHVELGKEVLGHLGELGVQQLHERRVHARVLAHTPLAVAHERDEPLPLLERIVDLGDEEADEGELNLAEQLIAPPRQRGHQLLETMRLIDRAASDLGRRALGRIEAECEHVAEADRGALVALHVRQHLLGVAQRRRPLQHVRVHEQLLLGLELGRRVRLVG